MPSKRIPTHLLVEHKQNVALAHFSKVLLKSYLKYENLSCALRVTIPLIIIPNVLWIGPRKIPSIIIDFYIVVDACLSTSTIITTATAIAMKSQGLIIPTVIETTTVLNTPLITYTKNAGTMKSRTRMSLEKRVTILPIGFESKNKIFARITRSLTMLCRLVTHTAKIQNVMADLNKQTKIKSTTAPTNMPG